MIVILSMINTCSLIHTLVNKNGLFVNGIRQTINGINPYKADIRPGIIQRYEYPIHLVNGIPLKKPFLRLAIRISTPSTNCVKRKLFGELNPLSIWNFKH